MKFMFNVIKLPFWCVLTMFGMLSWWKFPFINKKGHDDHSEIFYVSCFPSLYISKKDVIKALSKIVGKNNKNIVTSLKGYEIKTLLPRYWSVSVPNASAFIEEIEKSIENYGDEDSEHTACCGNFSHPGFLLTREGFDKLNNQSEILTLSATDVTHRVWNSYSRKENLKTIEKAMLDSNAPSHCPQCGRPSGHHSNGKCSGCGYSFLSSSTEEALATDPDDKFFNLMG